jgi:hypothetical protein
VCQLNDSRYLMEIDEDEQEFHIMQLPRLQYVTLLNVRVPFTLPWSSIRVLNLMGMQLDVCLEALSKCPNLLECNIGRTSTHNGEDRCSLTRHMVFESLESLAWSGGTCQSSKAFIRYCRFANLRALDLAESDLFRSHCGDEVLYQELLFFFQSLPSTLTFISFDWTFPNSRRTILDTLLCVPQLTELKLVSNDITEFIGQPISELIDDEYTPHPSIKYREAARVLPSLSKLFLYLTPIEDPKIFLRMIERLCTNGTKPGTFHFTVSNWVETWDKSVLVERLRPLVASGFNLQFVLYDCELDFS